MSNHEPAKPVRPSEGACFVHRRKRFDSLAELALDIRSSWNHATDRLWRRLDPAPCELTHNPWVVLQTVSREKLQRVLTEPAFRKTSTIWCKPGGMRRSAPHGAGLDPYGEN